MVMPRIKKSHYTTSILKNGISKQKRHHVHLSTDKTSAIQVEKRHGEPVLFAIAPKKLQHSGYIFYLSDNGVWLTELVPAQYLMLTSSA